MVSVKGKIMQTVEQADENTAFQALDLLNRRFDAPVKKITWDDIEEVEPDEWDLEMIKETENNPDCNIFITSEEMDARRKARKAK